MSSYTTSVEQFKTFLKDCAKVTGENNEYKLTFKVVDKPSNIGVFAVTGQEVLSGPCDGSIAWVDRLHKKVVVISDKPIKFPEESDYLIYGQRGYSKEYDAFNEIDLENTDLSSIRCVKNMLSGAYLKNVNAGDLFVGKRWLTEHVFVSSGLPCSTFCIDKIDMDEAFIVKCPLSVTLASNKRNTQMVIADKHLRIHGLAVGSFLFKYQDLRTSTLDIKLANIEEIHKFFKDSNKSSAATYLKKLSTLHSTDLLLERLLCNSQFETVVIDFNCGYTEQRAILGIRDIIVDCKIGRLVLKDSRYTNKNKSRLRVKSIAQYEMGNDHCHISGKIDVLDISELDDSIIMDIFSLHTTEKHYALLGEEYFSNDININKEFVVLTVGELICSNRSKLKHLWRIDNNIEVKKLTVKH